jgi:hypothetical protein
MLAREFRVQERLGLEADDRGRDGREWSQVQWRRQVSEAGGERGARRALTTVLSIMRDSSSSPVDSELIGGLLKGGLINGLQCPNHTEMGIG